MDNKTITVEDLTNIVKLIDVCAKRGTFEGAELGVVGALRERVVAFITASTPAVVEQPMEAPEAPVEEAAE